MCDGVCWQCDFIGNCDILHMLEEAKKKGESLSVSRCQRKRVNGESQEPPRPPDKSKFSQGGKNGHR